MNRMVTTLALLALVAAPLLPANVSAQTAPPQSYSASLTETALLETADFAPAIYHQAQETRTIGYDAELSQLEQLRELQTKVSQIVANNIETCVAVSDGVGFGSGVVVSEDGLVLTAGHVVAGNGEYEVIFPSGKVARAIPLGRNLDIDAGMVQIIDPGPWPFAELSDRVPEPGDWMIGLGHSGGYESGRLPPVRTGRYLRKRGYQMVTDAVLIGGDSGGPLFDTDGKVAGIHSSIGDNVAENRHVFISGFRQNWDRMFRGDHWGQLPELTDLGDAVKKPVIGITVDRQLDEARILRVKPESPASRSGLQIGDVIIEFNGDRVQGAGQLIELIGQREPGDSVPVIFDRGGSQFKTVIDIEESNG